MNPEISIIIPTFNRSVVLKKCLEAILNNSFTRSYEVIIIDDGSTDDTLAKISLFIGERGLDNFFIFTQKNGGPSKARNLGINKARAEILLIIGDDSIADKNLLAEHYLWHTQKYLQKNIAILGYNQWSPEIEITPFMKWLDEVGLQFSYSRLTDENSTSWRDFWTCNISLKKSFLMEYGLFDEDFPCAAWEDVELGWRLSKYDFQIKYNRMAIVNHYHPTSFASVKKRMLIHGYSQMILAEKMGSEYQNKLFNQPLKFFSVLFDNFITYSGLLFVLDKLAGFLETRKSVPIIFYPILFHFKLKGNKNYEKNKNHYC